MKHTTIIITIIIIKLFVIINVASTAVIIHSLDGNDWNVFDSNKRCKILFCFAFFSMNIFLSFFQYF